MKKLFILSFLALALALPASASVGTLDFGITNTVATIATTTSGAADVSTNNYVQLRNDILRITATTTTTSTTTSACGIC